MAHKAKKTGKEESKSKQQQAKAQSAADKKKSTKDPLSKKVKMQRASEKLSPENIRPGKKAA